ncbi:vegetative cell wall protein gp1-like isoform X3 [Triticum aestivum]|uniref:vegetative cell wall protein gp1 isoform X3 n=1 Tax=Triticum aestivum TaxID=4565 RepID=UPI001D0044C8|nr:vegetative cell wall protein gp1-like isoform X3 [Triticum aestivum]XP_044458500.1 vegetative cell wall protein gp1-like isoform X3 [Triticum aestivum]
MNPNLIHLQRRHALQRRRAPPNSAPSSPRRNPPELDPPSRRRSSPASGSGQRGGSSGWGRRGGSSEPDRSASRSSILPELPSPPQAASPATPHLRRASPPELRPLRRLAPLLLPLDLLSPLSLFLAEQGPPEGPWRHQPLISPDPAACTPNPPEMDPSRPDPAGSDRAPPSSSLEHRPARPTASALSVPARVCTRTTLVPLACSNRMGRRPSRPGIKPRPSPSHIFCRSIIAHLEISPDATTIFRCELCQHQPQSWNKECAFALMKQLSHSPLLLPTTTILHRYFLLDNYWR